MYYFHATIDSPNEIVALVVNLDRGEKISVLLERLYKENPSVLQDADVVIIRPPVYKPINPDIFSNNIIEGEEFRWFEGLFESPIEASFIRFPDRPVYILYSFEYNHRLSKNINPDAEVNSDDIVNSEPVILDIRNAELDALVETGRAILPNVPGFVYRAPSGYAQSRFLRVGNIQRSQAALDALFFWLIPYLRRTRGIVTETWSIASTGLNVSGRMLIYQGGGSAPCGVEMLQGYLEAQSQADEATDVIKKLLTHALQDYPDDNGTSKVLFLQSAVNSGTLFRRVQESLRDHGVSQDSLEYVALFNLGKFKASFSCLRDLSAENGNGEFAPIEELHDKEEIKIDPRTYFVSQYEDVEMTLSVREAGCARDFLNQYKASSMFRVHKDVNEGASRHHAVWIDTVLLMQNEIFRQKMNKAIIALNPKPKIILTPDHEAGHILAKYAVETLSEIGVFARHLFHQDLNLDSTLDSDNEIAAAIDAIGNEDAVLILDDCFITGDRIKTFQKHMRRRSFSGSVHYMVAVARPEQLSTWQKTQRMLRYPRNSIQAIETILMPDWDESCCPWCLEASLYQQYVDKEDHKLSDALQARRSHIEEGAASGLEQGLFLHPEGKAQLDFQKDSIFASNDRSEADLFAAIASAVQYLRNPAAPGDPPRPVLGPRHYPIATVMVCRDYLKETFNESRIRACIIRSLHPYEMNYTSKEKVGEKNGLLYEIINSEDRSINELTIEVAIAFQLGKMEGCGADPLRVAFAQLGCSNEFGALNEL